MSGVELTGHGGPEKLVWRDDLPVPEPTHGEVLVRVLAAGVNNTDINTRIGWYSKTVTGATNEALSGDDVEQGGWSGGLRFPLIQGGDLCGEVVESGPGVTGFSPGMRVTCPINQPVPTKDNPLAINVLGSEFNGAFAQYCVVPADQLFDVSASPLSDIEIGAIPCAFGTAMGMLMRADVGADDRVLVTGASGGVGMAAVMIAKIKGAQVTAMTAPAKVAAVKAAGADDVIGRDDKPDAGAYSVVIDLVGGDGWAGLIDALKPGGRYAVAGAIAGPMVTADLRSIYLNDITIFGCTYQSPAVFAALVDLMIAGDLKPLVSQTYPLKDIVRAQGDFTSKRYAGKLVLIP